MRKLMMITVVALAGASGYGPGVAVPYQNHVILNDTDEYTCEMFFRFDRARYAAQQASGADGTSPISLCGIRMVQPRARIPGRWC